jgi:hypothetical protein
VLEHYEEQALAKQAQLQDMEASELSDDQHPPTSGSMMPRLPISSSKACGKLPHSGPTTVAIKKTRLSVDSAKRRIVLLQHKMEHEQTTTPTSAKTP